MFLQISHSRRATFQQLDAAVFVLLFQHHIKSPRVEFYSKEIALQIGNEKAVRAVGAANGKNPISIIAPCHRVIGSSGALVGFAGGLDKKQILLSLEQSQIR